MKKLFKKKKKSHSEAGSVADLSNSGYDISPKKDLSKLHRAAFEGDLNKLKSLLKKGDVNEADQEKRTPMHLCCASGKIDAVRMLADEPRINFNMCDKSGRTPLMVCVQCQFHKCLDILLRKGADLSLADDKGNTALHLAVSLPSTEITYLLLDYGIDIHCKNKDDNTPLHIAATVSNSEDVIKTLVADGALVDSRNRSEKTPLMIAASRGYIPVVKQLLQSGADTELKDSNGWTANDLANSNGHHPLSYIIVEHAMKKQGGGSRPQSARQGSAATSSTSMSPVHQQQQRAVAGSRRGSSSAAAAAAMVGAPAMQQDESSSEDEETSKVMSAVVGNEAGGGDNDLWSVTDEDDNPLFDDDDDHEATDKKPAGGGGGKVNVMQFLRDRQKNKLAMEAPGHTYKEQEMGEEDNEAGSGWSSSSSSTSTSEDLEYTSRKKQQTPSETTAKANPDHQPPPPAAVPQAADSPKPSPRNNFSKWDSTDDDDDDDDAYRPSVAAALPDDTNQAKKDMLSELGFDEDELSATGDEGDDSSQPTPSPPLLHHDPAPAQAAPPPPEPAPAPEIVTPEFEPVAASPAPKPEQVPPKVAAPKPEAPPVETAASSRHDSGEDSSSSDWDSDAEDDESRENFDAGGAVNYVQAADDMKFDDELIISSGDSSDDDDASLISGLDDDSDAPPEDVEVKQENEEERVAVMASPVPVKALTPPISAGKSFAGGYAAADDSSVSSVEENKLMKHQFQTENSKVKGGGSDATATSSEDARSEAPSPQQRHHNDNGAGFPRHHDYHHQANDEWGSNGAMEEREELVACIRKLNFELTALKEREKSHQLEVETEREGAVKCQEDLQVERDNRRKLEVTIRDLKHELQCISQTLNCVEEDRKRLQEELVQSIRQNQVRQKLDKMNDQVEMETQRHRWPTSKYDDFSQLFEKGKKGRYE